MITEENENPSYYTNIPASVRYDKEIPANAKLLYGEIGCLSNKYGYCFAKNDYFAELYDLSEDRISKLIHLLEKKGYVEIELERNDQRFVINRKIKLLDPNMLPSKVKNNESNGKNNYGEKLKITSSNGKNNGSNNNTYNTNTLNTNTNPFPKPEKQTFKRSDYSECVRLISQCQKTLRDKNFNIDTTEYPIPALNKWLKKWFEEYGVDKVKKGITNSISNQWLVKNANYSISALFSDTVFPKCVSDFTEPNKIQKGKSFFEDKQRDFSNIQDGGNW